MSVDADRYLCAQCSEIHERVCARIAADRIAELTAELAEMKRQRNEEKDQRHLWYSTVVDRDSELDAERAAHERTKADLAVVRKAFDLEQENMQKNVRATVRAIAERDTALLHTKGANTYAGQLAEDAGRYMRERDAAQAEADTWREDNRVLGERLVRYERERDAAQAEAAAMRDALGSARIEISRMATTGTGFSCSVVDDIEAALDGTTGRALAARVPLWRELHEAVKAEDWRHAGRVALVLGQLSVLDEKGTTDV